MFASELQFCCPCHLFLQRDLTKLFKANLIIDFSMFPRSTHKSFAEKLYQTFSDHKRFKRPKLSQSDFTIRHYAGDVCTSVHRTSFRVFLITSFVFLVLA